MCPTIYGHLCRVGPSRRDRASPRAGHYRRGAITRPSFSRLSGHLVGHGLRNYWGYDSLGYFAPYAGYSASGQAGEQVKEFKQMVKALHQAGIEVLLDVVYNHTGEGNHLGPTLTLRGLDNAAYYRLVDDLPAITWTLPAAAIPSTCAIPRC